MSRKASKRSGVYEIRTPVGEIYIGSAVDFDRRIRNHIGKLKKGTHVNKKLQTVFDMYQGALVMRLIYKCAPKKVIQHEQRLIDKHKPTLNILKRAGSLFGFRFSLEQKERKKIAYAAVKKEHKAATKLVMNDPIIKARHLAAVNSLASKRKLRKIMRDRWKNPVAADKYKKAIGNKTVQAKRIVKMLETFSRPEIKAKMIAAGKRNKKKRIAAAEAAWRDPEKRARIIAARWGNKHVA